ncbi:MAG TPA: NAD(P)/FAD-dependent oxidoreductase [Nocardioides sp.]|uniref:NAD(P)/FAD-dependent oxidoreductase n=1 Tax=Nocardioides sp. TaxID=35761 RepID=UPI002E328436|nr:NAD(P)/FAD-dependent oxidoreductase [Nocardioides sp.]HEX5088077.1 NAD(P)/FAD-dependent oxidoreductase [Nocardioides sp.]
MTETSTPESASASAATVEKAHGGGRRHQVVVIGSGFGGLFGTKALKRSDVDVTMIAKTTHHLFQPLLYQVATGILSEGEIAPPTREVLARQKNAKVLLGEVTDIDLEAQTVTSHVLGRETVTPYDSLIVAAGSSQSYFGNDGFAEYAPGMKSIDDALELRGRIFGAFELAELAAMRGEDVDALLTFVVVGAGPTGVEMAGQIAELSRRTLHRDFHAINSREARVILVDAAGQVLPPFGAELGVKTKRALEKLGVEVRLGAMVTDVDEGGLELKLKDGTVERIESTTKIWAAGVQANALTKTLSEQTGAPLDRAGRIGVNPDLTLPGHPEVFVIGDMIDLDHLPGVAQVAIQGAKYAAKAIDRRLEGKPPQKPFKYFDKGSLATISRFRAVALIGPLRLTGVLAWFLWLGVHILYLTGFKNRVSAVLHWAVSFVGRGRQERTATEQQIFGRLAMNRLDHGAADLVSGPTPEQTAEIQRRQEARRAELEAIAVEEARLTDAGERGVKVEADA